MGHRKQVLHLAKVVAAMFFPPHPYIVGATDSKAYPLAVTVTYCGCGVTINKSFPIKKTTT